jgi:hypothetical protein
MSAANAPAVDAANTAPPITDIRNRLMTRSFATLYSALTMQQLG